MPLKDYRLKKEKDFNLLFKKGNKLYSKTFTLLFLPADGLKAGYAVGKKFGCSVKRNRIKRIFRESFRSFIPDLQENFFFVFIPKILEEYDFHRISEDMRYIFNKGNFFKDKTV